MICLGILYTPSKIHLDTGETLSQSYHISGWYKLGETFHIAIIYLDCPLCEIISLCLKNAVRMSV